MIEWSLKKWNVNERGRLEEAAHCFNISMENKTILHSHIKTEHQRKPLREIDILHVAIDQILWRGLDEMIHGFNIELQNETMWLPQCEIYKK